jgi:hypothetical protein
MVNQDALVDKESASLPDFPQGAEQLVAGSEPAMAPPVNARSQRAVNCPEAADGISRGTGRSFREGHDIDVHGKAPKFIISMELVGVSTFRPLY